MIKVKKRSLGVEKFNSKKLKTSILKSGVPEKEATKVVGKLKNKIGEEITSNQLQDLTYKELKKHSYQSASLYNLKKAIFKLGPEGYPFEAFVAELLKAQGYNSKVSVTKKGKYVTHEIDVVALKKNKKETSFYYECKFHNRSHYKNDVKIPLYIYSRYLDLTHFRNKKNLKYGIYSNTRFSKDAISFSKGVGLKLVSMNYPEDESLFELVKKFKIYPITILKSLKVYEQNCLKKQKIVTLNQLTHKVLKSLRVDEARIKKVLRDTKELLG